MAIIEAKDLSKTYPATSGKRALLGRGGIGTWFRSAPDARPALQSITLHVKAGETVGIIGRNGSGKSTLLKLIAAVTAPTSGSLAVHGRVASLLELGAGFHPMLTGRENVYMNAGLLGMRHAAVRACFDDIVAFAGMAEFIDRTVDTYSSGMYVRLAFSVAVHSNPDIFLVDEVLSVGDEAFQRKCRARIMELKAAGKTILFVSHDLGSVQALCDRVVLLDDGKVISRGTASDTINYYLRQVGEADGIHRLQHQAMEVLFNHGRVALFHQQREVTAPAGIKVQFRSLGAYHESADATWRIRSCDETHLEAEGAMARLPVIVFLSIGLAAEGLIVAVDWENSQSVDIDYAAIQCFFPAGYTGWHYGAECGEFPVIPPSARHWSPVAVPRGDDWSCNLHSESDVVQPVVVRLDEHGTQARLQIDNTDYMSAARLVHVTEILPSGAGAIPPGRRPLARLTVDPQQSLEHISAHNESILAAQAIDLGLNSARLIRGGVELRRDGRALTHGMRLHVQLRVGRLWVMSTDLLWSPVQEENGTRIATGRSMRLPLRMELRLSEQGGAFELAIALETDASVAVAEYNVSLGLAAGYRKWQNEHEAGDFVDVEAVLDEWTCLNRTYEAGTWIRAEGGGVPPLSLSAERACGEVLPCAMRTSPTQDASVIQLLCPSGSSGAHVFGPGRSELFVVRVAIGAAE